MGQAASSSTMSAMAELLNQIIKAFNDATDAAAKEMKKLAQDGFSEVRTKLDSLYDFFFKRAPEGATVKDLAQSAVGRRFKMFKFP